MNEESALTVEAALKLAEESYENGNLAYAELIYTEILKVDPDNRIVQEALGILQKDKEVFQKYGMVFTRDAFTKYNFAEVGRFTYGTPSVRWYGEPTRLRIGSFCCIAYNVTIFIGGNHRVDWISTYPFSAPDFGSLWPEARGITGFPHSNGDVIIENDVWIAEGSAIMSGVRIGSGAVIAAHSLVTKGVAPYEIVGGNPARHIGFRFPQEAIDLLLRIRWWDWKLDKIREAAPLLCSQDLEGLERYWEAMRSGTDRHPAQTLPRTGLNFS